MTLFTLLEKQSISPNGKKKRNKNKWVFAGESNIKTHLSGWNLFHRLQKVNICAAYESVREAKERPSEDGSSRNLSLERATADLKVGGRCQCEECDCACQRAVTARGRAAERCSVSGGWPSAGLLQAWCQPPWGRRQQHLVAHFGPHVCSDTGVERSGLVLREGLAALAWHLSTHDDLLGFIWGMFRWHQQWQKISSCLSSPEREKVQVASVAITWLHYLSAATLMTVWCICRWPTFAAKRLCQKQSHRKDETKEKRNIESQIRSWQS